MRPGYEEPVETPGKGPGNLDETVTTHPAFGQISASRVNGHTNLYGSDFTHNGYVTITIKTSELHRNLSNDWHFETGQLIEVALSEAQWATFVSSLNNGSGVPCTLEWIAGKGRLPRLPNPKSRVDQFGKEFQKSFDEALEALEELQSALAASGLSKKKIDELLSRARRAQSAIQSSAPFVTQQFGEHMENEVESAKVEVHGYIQNLIQRAGLEALAGPSDPIVLSLEKDSD
jgi:hypothetical protein